MKRFEVVTLGFAALLLYSAAKLLFQGDDGEDEVLEKYSAVRSSQSLLPFNNQYYGNGSSCLRYCVKLAHPLTLALLLVEFSNIFLALDHLPAVLSISDDALVIYLWSILAIMGF